MQGSQLKKSENVKLNGENYEFPSKVRTLELRLRPCVSVPNIILNYGIKKYSIYAFIY